MSRGEVTSIVHDTTGKIWVFLKSQHEQNMKATPWWFKIKPIDMYTACQHVKQNYIDTPHVFLQSPLKNVFSYVYVP